VTGRPTTLSTHNNNERVPRSVCAPRTTKKQFAFCICAFIFTFFVSNYFAGIYTGGDQRHYNSIYNRVVGISIVDVPQLQRRVLSAGEPLYGIVIWIAANAGIEKNLTMSFFNGCLAFSLSLLLFRYKAPISIHLLALSNYYLVVMELSAERLKFSYIFIILACYASGNIRRVLMTLAIVSHFQTLINCASSACLACFDFVNRRKPVSPRAMAIAASTVLTTSVILYYYIDDLSRKTSRTYDGDYLYSMLSLMILFLVGMIITKERARFLFAMLPIFGAVVLLGPARVNMIGVLVFFYHILLEGRITHPLSYAVLIYFAGKTYQFLGNVIEYGNGFPDL
jgi:hypothetical protein